MGLLIKQRITLEARYVIFLKKYLLWNIKEENIDEWTTNDACSKCMWWIW